MEPRAHGRARVATIVGIAALGAAMLASSAACKGGGGTGNLLDPDREGGTPPPGPPGPPGADAGVDSGPACDGIPIVDDGVLDLDVPAERWVRVSGAVTLAGAPIPFDVDYPGSLVFSDDRGQSRTAAIESGRYDVLLRSGRYDVRFAPDDTSCSDADRVGMPCSGGTLRESLALESDGVLDLDVPVATVRGTVTLDTMPYPAGEGGSIVFAPSDARGAAATISLGLSGSYAVRLFPADYDVAFGEGAAYCDGRTAPRLPCNGGTLREDLSLTSGGVLDLDVPTAHVEGAATLNGASFPFLESSPGALAFVREDQSALVIALPQDAPSSYRATVLAGTYDVRFVPDAYLCSYAENPPAPCNGGLLRENVALASPGGVLDVDIPAVHVSGRVTVNGAAFEPSSTGGAIALASTDAGSETSIVIAPWQSGSSYATTLFPGTYAILWQGDASACGLGSPALLPCHSGIVRDGVALTSEGVLDVDIPAVVVRGQVTVDGQTMADATSDRGQIAFLGRGSDGGLTRLAAVDLGSFGPASYAVTLLAGSWVPAWSPGSVCYDDPRQSVPCVGGPLSDAVTLMAPGGVLDLDVPTIEVHGRVTVGGREMPPASEERGSLRFEPIDGQGVSTPAFPATGPADYAVTLMPGRYAIHWTPSTWLCPPESTAPSVPCEPQALRGCSSR